MTEILGLIAACLTTFSFIPQAIKVIRTQSTDDLSPLMYATFVAGVLLWLIYGIVKQDLAITLANAVTAVFASIIFYYVIKNHLSQRKKRV